MLIFLLLEVVGLICCMRGRKYMVLELINFFSFENAYLITDYNTSIT